VRESNPPGRLGRPEHNHYANSAKKRPAGVEPTPLNWQTSVQPQTPWARKRSKSREPDSHRHDVALQATAYLFEPSRHGPSRKRRESNSRGTVWPGGLANRCAKPTCTSLPWETKESGGIEPLALPRPPRFSGPVTRHSVALSAGSQGLEPCKAGFGDLPAPCALPMFVEPARVALAFSACRAGVLLLDDGPIFGGQGDELGCSFHG
jgi:hypothetical protein